MDRQVRALARRVVAEVAFELTALVRLMDSTVTAEVSRAAEGGLADGTLEGTLELVDCVQVLGEIRELTESEGAQGTAVLLMARCLGWE